MTTPAPGDPLRFTVAFPAINVSALNRSPANFNLEDVDLGSQFRKELPHWLYHVEILPPYPPPSQGRFSPVTTDWVARLAHYLGLPGTADVAPLELVPNFRRA